MRRRYGSTRAIAATAGFLGGIIFVRGFGFLAYGLQSDPGAQAYLLPLTLYFVFGLAVARWWALCYPAAWFGFGWWFSNWMSTRPVDYQVHPLVSFGMVAAVMSCGVLLGRQIPARTLT